MKKLQPFATLLIDLLLMVGCLWSAYMAEPESLQFYSYIGIAFLIGGFASIRYRLDNIIELITATKHKGHA